MNDKITCSFCYNANEMEECADCCNDVCTNCLYYADNGDVICPDCHADDPGEDDA